MQLDDDELTLDSFLLFMKIPAFISSRATFQKQKVSLLKKLSSNSQTCIGRFHEVRNFLELGIEVVSTT